MTALAAGDTGSFTVNGLRLSGLYFLPVGVQGLINVRFPSGRPVGWWGRLLDRVLWIGLTAAVLSTFFGSAGTRDVLPTAPVDVELPAIGGPVVAAIANATRSFAPAVVLLGLIAGLGVVVRCWRARGNERQQLKWRAAGVVVSLVLYPAAVTESLSPVGNSVDSLLFVATLAIPVLRYRLWAIDTIIRRSVVYGAVTAVLIGGYALITALGAGLASERVGAGVGAAVAVLAFGPVRQLTQRVVDRLFYGQRSDPYRALDHVGQRLESAGGAVLPAVVDAVAASLRLPYVAIERDGAVLAAAGETALADNDRASRWPLRFQSEPVGFLVAVPRRGEDSFDVRDQRILADIARQAGPAVRAAALTSDLQDARLRLVNAREDDRRRLRRDLHDGLGPMLTGLGLNIDAARARLAAALAADPLERSDRTDLARAEIRRADDMLATAKDVSAQVIKDLRTMVYDLRPPALDELGLPGAVRLHAQRLAAGTDLKVQIESAPMPELPAAVEVAAFRTAVEAITNAIRHGAASACTVRLSLTPDALVLEATDDGRSAAPWLAGVGLTAMRERAEEIGGVLTAGPSDRGGHVLARYPLAQATS